MQPMAGGLRLVNLQHVQPGAVGGDAVSVASSLAKHMNVSAVQSLAPHFLQIVCNNMVPGVSGYISQEHIQRALAGVIGDGKTGPLLASGPAPSGARPAVVQAPLAAVQQSVHSVQNAAQLLPPGLTGAAHQAPALVADLQGRRQLQSGAPRMHPGVSAAAQGSLARGTVSLGPGSHPAPTSAGANPQLRPRRHTCFPYTGFLVITMHAWVGHVRS